MIFDAEHTGLNSGPGACGDDGDGEEEEALGTKRLLARGTATEPAAAADGLTIPRTAGVTNEAAATEAVGRMTAVDDFISSAGPAAGEKARGEGIGERRDRRLSPSLSPSWGDCGPGCPSGADIASEVMALDNSVVIFLTAFSRGLALEGREAEEAAAAEEEAAGVDLC